MNNELKKNYLLNVDSCDSYGEITLPAFFTFMQNISIEHADILGLHPYYLLKKNEFWVVTHIILKIIEPIYFTEEFELTTWPQKSAETLRNYRQYRFEKNNKVFALGKSQWAVLKNKNVIELNQSSFPNNLIYPEREEFNQALAQFIDDFSDDDLVKEYKVSSTDIDINHHMNNVAYLRTLLSCFSVEQIHSVKFNSVEIHYGKSAYENEVLKIYIKNENKNLRFAIKKDNGKNAVIGKIEYTKR
ncbi:MAG: thioesterase [Erysipelotrichia bacterium]|nr:thioesterase [Erysipelotrichia bacterium]